MQSPPMTRHPSRLPPQLQADDQGRGDREYEDADGDPERHSHDGSSRNRFSRGDRLPKAHCTTRKSNEKMMRTSLRTLKSTRPVPLSVPVRASAREADQAPHCPSWTPRPSRIRSFLKTTTVDSAIAFSTAQRLEARNATI